MNKKERNAIQNLEHLITKHNYFTFDDDILIVLNLAKAQDKAIDLILDDLNVEEKGTSKEALKTSYILRAKSNGTFIKGEDNE